MLLVGVGFLFAAAQLPTAPVHDRLEAALADGRLWTQEYSVVQVGLIEVTLVDGWSECTSLGQALSQAPLPFSERPNGRFNPDDGSCRALADALVAPLSDFSYPRFYHGASALIRAALQVMNLEWLRCLVTLTILALVGILCALSWAMTRWLAVGLAVFFLVLTDTPYQGLSVSHGMSTAAGILGAIATLLIARRYPGLVLGTAAAAGVLYALIAQLYVPVEFAILTAVVVMSVALGDWSSRMRWLRLGAIASVTWIAGYAFAMIVRFIWIALAEGVDASTSEGSTAATTRLTSDLLQPIRTVVWNLISVQMLEWKVRELGLVMFVAMAAFLLGFARRWALARREVLWALVPTLLAAMWIMTFGGHNGHGWVVNVLYAVLLNGYVVILLNYQSVRVSGRVGASPGERTSAR
jgi:hypothetical protein